MEWISVKDRLPKRDVKVLATDGILVGIAWYSHKIDQWLGADSDQVYGFNKNINMDALMGDLLYWMPLPEPPKG